MHVPPVAQSLTIIFPLTLVLSYSASPNATRSRQVHESDVVTLAWRPDGRELAASSLNGNLTLWDVSGTMTSTSLWLIFHLVSFRSLAPSAVLAVPDCVVYIGLLSLHQVGRDFVLTGVTFGFVLCVKIGALQARPTSSGRSRAGRTSRAGGSARSGSPQTTRTAGSASHRSATAPTAGVRQLRHQFRPFFFFFFFFPPPFFSSTISQPYTIPRAPHSHDMLSSVPMPIGC